MNLSWIGVLGLLVTVDSAPAQMERDGIELFIRELMPSPMRCDTLAWEPVFYCRYETSPQPNAVFELSFGPGGPAGSLTYNIGSEGPRLLKTMRLFLSKAGIQEKTLDECVEHARSKSGDFPFRSSSLYCRYVNFADRVAYEIFVERER